MSGFSLTVEDSFGQLIERIDSAIVGCDDFTPFWEMLRTPWERSRKRMYDTQGRYTDTPWPTYDQTDERRFYVWWKAGVTGIDINSPSELNRLVLRWTKNERLYPSIVNTRDSRAIWRPEPNSLTIGSRAQGAAQNNGGLGKAPLFMGGHDIPTRPLFSFGRAFTQEVGQIQSAFAGEVSRRLGDGSRVRSGLTTNQVRGRMLGGAR